MGILETLIGTVTGLGEKKNLNKGLVDGVMSMFKSEGVGGIVNLFKGKGLESLISSWVSKGNNMPVSVDQLKDVLGEDRLREIAKKAGVSEEDSLSAISDLLPDIIDKISPNGVLSDDDE